MRLTFDDGPSENTQQLLPVLAQAGMTATFFMVGESVEERPDLVREVLQAGHAIGNHSYSHPRLTDLDDEGVRGELRRCTAALERAGAPRPELCRPPYGRTDDRVRRIIAAEGMEQVLWDVDVRDWEAKVTPEQIEQRISEQLAKAPSDPIVLLHDGRGDRTPTVAAVRSMLG